jgi:putative addiction module killer protein
MFDNLALFLLQYFMQKQIKTYKKPNNREPFIEWYNKLDKKIQNIIANRLDRLELGSYGDWKNLGDGVKEFRFNLGYRIYFGEYQNTIVLLLLGGDKGTQEKDIEKAK